MAMAHSVEGRFPFLVITGLLNLLSRFPQFKN